MTILWTGNHHRELKQRQPETHPRAACCKTAYRRICGVCKHYSGEMRGEGRCNLFFASVRGSNRRAETCQEWGRKDANWKSIGELTAKLVDEVSQ